MTSEREVNSFKDKLFFDLKKVRIQDLVNETKKSSSQLYRYTNTGERSQMTVDNYEQFLTLYAEQNGEIPESLMYFMRKVQRIINKKEVSDPITASAKATIHASQLNLKTHEFFSKKGPHSRDAKEALDLIHQASADLQEVELAIVNQIGRA